MKLFTTNDYPYIYYMISISKTKGFRIDSKNSLRYFIDTKPDNDEFSVKILWL